jgi:hypothetical protein
MTKLPTLMGLPNGDVEMISQISIGKRALIGILLVVLPILIVWGAILIPPWFADDHTLSPVFAYEEESEKYVHYDETDPRINITLVQLTVANEAVIQFYYHLYANSTGNITLLIDPETEWNLTSIQVNIGEEINTTVTNGNLNLDSDVFAIFTLILQRENVNDEIWAYLSIGIITRGWHKTPWPVFPGILAFVVLLVRRYRKILN